MAEAISGKLPETRSNLERVSKPARELVRKAEQIAPGLAQRISSETEELVSKLDTKTPRGEQRSCYPRSSTKAPALCLGKTIALRMSRWRCHSRG